MAREKDSWNDNNVPTLDEYLSFSWKSIGIKISVFTAIDFLGRKITEDVWKCSEFASLDEHACLVGRLLNDVKTFKVHSVQIKCT